MMTRNNRLTIPRVIAAALALTALALPACSSNDGATTDRRMFVLTEDFNNGRDDGLRDAKASWTEDSAAWTWIWMMNEQYQKGYEHGWREGRTQAKLEAQQHEANNNQP